MATRNFHPLSRLQILLCSLHTQWCEFLSKNIHICHLVYWGGGIYGKRSAWTRADGGGELSSRRNKKREISRNLFSINLHSWVLSFHPAISFKFIRAKTLLDFITIPTNDDGEWVFVWVWADAEQIPSAVTRGASVLMQRLILSDWDCLIQKDHLE